MARYLEYKPKKVLNVYKHCDGGWYWNRYSANPYVGCEYGCEYCYYRARKYFRQDWEFYEVIKVKVNAPLLLSRELKRVERDIIMLGYYQPVEVKYGLIRKMLEVCADLGFPVHLNEKSDLILKDLDLLKEINEKSWACVTFSIISLREDLRFWEPKAPPPERRLEAMKEISRAGIKTGTALIPALPFVYDDEENIEEVVKETKQHGGSYVIGGGLTLGSPLTEHYLSLLRKFKPEAVGPTLRIFSGKSSSLSDTPSREHQSELGRKVMEICNKLGLDDRLKRPIHIYPNELRTNKAVANYLFEKTYRLEIQNASQNKVWAYRKAAWTLDELKEDVRKIYEEEGLQGLKALPNVGSKIAGEIEALLKNISPGE